MTRPPRRWAFLNERRGGIGALRGPGCIASCRGVSARESFWPGLVVVCAWVGMAAAQKSLRVIFDEASELEAGEPRHAYLDEACNGDAALRANVEELLRAQE